MRITPLDIRKQPFRRTMRGFDPDAVNSFLEMVASEYESIIGENSAFATRIKNLEQRLEAYEKIERMLNETLLTAQKVTDEARVNAQKEAELIIKDAMVRAQRYEDEARKRVHDLESEAITLRNQRDSFLARFKAMLTTQLNLLGVISGELRGLQGDESGSLMELADEETEMDDAPPQPDVSATDA